MSYLKPNNFYYALRNAIKKKDKVTAKKLIENKSHVNVSYVKGHTLLHWAIIRFDDLDIVTMLLDRGANIHAKNHYNYKPLQVAIQNNKIDAVQLLIRRGALVGENLFKLLFIAIEQNNEVIVKILIDNGVQNNPLIDLKFPLNIAILRGQPKIIEYILPHCKFVQSSDRFIPKEVVIKFGSEYKECVELLLKWNFTINPDCKHNRMFVYRAVENGYLPIVLQLLEFGIDVNMINPNTGLNLLKVACFNSYHDIVENLLKSNASVDETILINSQKLKHNEWSSDYVYKSNSFDSLIHCKINLCNVTCLQIAVLNSDLQMTQLLLKYGATIVDDPKFFYITGIAVHNSCEKIVHIFLDHGVDVNDVDFEGKSLLHYCVSTGVKGQDVRYNIVKLLLERGAISHIQSPGNSLLFDAINNGHSKTAQLFLDYSADIQYNSLNGDTVLHKAIEQDCNVEFIKTLLKRELPVNSVNKKMRTPLHVACKVKSPNQLEIVQTLLKYNANVNNTDDNLMTPLHFACQNQNLEVVIALLGKGANPNTIDNEGQTPLHLICKRKSDFTLIIIQLLLHHTANIEAVDVKDWTPLFVACDTNNEIAVKRLLDGRANTNRTDKENLTPFYIAAKKCKGNSEIIKIFLKHKVNVHCIDKRGNSLIHLIATYDFSELIENFAETQINFNSVNKEGNTALHIAIRNKSVKMTESLIKYGANVNILDKRKQTCLYNAIEYTCDHQYIHKNIRNYFSWCVKTFYCYDKNNSWSTNSSVRNYKNHPYGYKEIIDILKIQVIKLKVAKLKVNNQNLKLVYGIDKNQIRSNQSLDKILQLEVDCEKEIEKMKIQSIGVKNITFYNLLTKNIHFLSKLVKNDKIRKILKLQIYNTQFPLYINTIRSRFRDAKFRYRMLSSAKKYFTLNVCQQLSDDSIDIIFSYLEMKDLKMFIKAMKSLNTTL